MLHYMTNTHGIHYVIEIYVSLINDCVSMQSQQELLATLYLPLYGIILDNLPRIFMKDMFPFNQSSSNPVSVT